MSIGIEVVATRFFFATFSFLLSPCPTWNLKRRKGFLYLYLSLSLLNKSRHVLKGLRWLWETTPLGPSVSSLFRRIRFIYLPNGLRLPRFTLLFNIVFLVFRFLLNYVFQFLQLLIRCPIFSLYPSFCLIHNWFFASIQAL